MGTEEITIQIDDEAARAFKSASAGDRRKLEALVSIQLIEATKTKDSLKQIMSGISRKAQERGLSRNCNLKLTHFDNLILTHP
jgi:hypothetical protein